MKDLRTFIYESSNELISIIKRMMGSVDYNKLQSWSEQDPDKFDKQKENELLIAKDFNEGDFTIIGTAEYYSKVKDGDFNKLSQKEKSEFDTQNGDLIIMKNDKPVYFIDVKISDKYLGAVSLGSLVNFNKDGYYLLICKTGKFFKVISHKEVEDAVKNGKLNLNAPVNSYKGYDVKWEGEDMTSEWFIKGNDLRKL
jgi:hypothetical protein